MKLFVSADIDLNVWENTVRFMEHAANFDSLKYSFKLDFTPTQKFEHLISALESKTIFEETLTALESKIKKSKRDFP